MRVTAEDGVVRIEDLESTYGLYLNGNRTIEYYTKIDTTQLSDKICVIENEKYIIAVTASEV